MAGVVQLAPSKGRRRRRDWSTWSQAAPWAALPLEAWESAAAALPMPWHDEWAVADMRYWQSVTTAPGSRAALPSRSTLARRWGWTDDEVRGLLSAEGVWSDPSMTGERRARWARVQAARLSTRAKPQPSPSQAPAKPQPSPSQAPATDGRTSRITEDSPSPAPAQPQPSPSQAPADPHRRASHPAPTPTPQVDTHTESPAQAARSVWGRHRRTVIERLGVAPADIAEQPPRYVVQAVEAHGREVCERALAWAWRSDDRRAAWWRAERRLVGPGWWRQVGDALAQASAWERERAGRAAAAPAGQAELTDDEAADLLLAVLEAPGDHADVVAMAARLGCTVEAVRAMTAAELLPVWRSLDGAA